MQRVATVALGDALADNGTETRTAAADTANTPTALRIRMVIDLQ